MSKAISFLFLIIVLVLYVVWFYRRSAALLNDWIDANGFALVEAERRFAWTSPFFLRASRSQQIFRVRVYDPVRHRSRGAWVRVGSFWLGLASADIDVRWDDDEIDGGHHAASLGNDVENAQSRSALAQRPTRSVPLAAYFADRLVQVGSALLILGTGPLLIIILLAKLHITADPDPNPIGFGLLAGLTFWPALICLAIGISRVWRGERR